MASHLLTMLVFAALTSAVFAFLLRDDPKSRWRFAIKAFAAFVLAAIAVGWVMYPFPS